MTALASTWQFPITATRKIEAGPNGDIRATVSSDDGPFYLAAESTDFSRPPTSSQWAIEPSKSFRLAASLLSSDPGLDLDIWVVQYNGRSDFGRHRPGEPGHTALSFRLGPRPTRSKWPCDSQVKDLPTWDHLGSRNESSDGSRSRRLADHPARLSSYAGEDLIFILGAPRSGTTWLLRLIAEHPAVAAATVDNLALRGTTTKHSKQTSSTRRGLPTASYAERSIASVSVLQATSLLRRHRFTSSTPTGFVGCSQRPLSCSLIATLLPSSTRCSTLAGQRTLGGRGHQPNQVQRSSYG